MNNKICVFCSSSDIIDTMYNTLAKNLAEMIGEGENNLIFGGSNVGMMRILAENVKKNNSVKIIGVIPERIAERVGANPLIDDLLIVPDMYARKAKMAELADAFIALPGGFGTLEEISEVITHKQLGYHNKPIVFVNYNGFYDNLLKFLDDLYSEQFAKEVYRQLYYVAKDAQDAMDYISGYQAPVYENKWFITNENQQI